MLLGCYLKVICFCTISYCKVHCISHRLGKIWSLISCPFSLNIYHLRNSCYYVHGNSKPIIFGFDQGHMGDPYGIGGGGRVSLGSPASLCTETIFALKLYKRLWAFRAVVARRKPKKNEKP